MTDVDSELQVRSTGARVVIRIIRFYQLVRSGRPPVCRFSPTCSAYAAEAVARHGALRGSWMAARRVSRCRPLGGFGFDPVPGTERRVGDQEHAHV